VRKVLRGNPNAGIVSVSQNDNGNYCNDSVAQQIMQEEGTPGEHDRLQTTALAGCVFTPMPRCVFTQAVRCSAP